jgi:hypothetical protein
VELMDGCEEFLKKQKFRYPVHVEMFKCDAYVLVLSWDDAAGLTVFKGHYLGDEEIIIADERHWKKWPVAVRLQAIQHMPQILDQINDHLVKLIGRVEPVIDELLRCFDIRNPWMDDDEAHERELDRMYGPEKRRKQKYGRR